MTKCASLEVEQLHGKIPIEVMYLPRPSSNYKGCYPKYFEKHLSRLLETKNYVHFFSGSATTGYKIDIIDQEDSGIDLIADVQDLKEEIKDNTFDGGMADPPYDERFAKELYNCDYPQWSKWTSELVRIVKSNGLIGIMQNYVVPRLPNCEYEKIIIILLRIKQFPKIVTIQRKTLHSNGETR